MMFFYSFVVSALIVLVSTLHFKWWEGRWPNAVSSILLGSLVTLMVLAWGGHVCAQGKPPSYLAFIGGLAAGAVPWCRSFSLSIRRLLAFCIAMLFVTMVGLLVSSYHSPDITGNPKLANGRYWHTALTGQYPRGANVGQFEQALMRCLRERIYQLAQGADESLAVFGQPESVDPDSKWLKWVRPVDNPVFTTTMGNNHDSVLFVEPELEYPYHLIISHTPKAAHLWRAKKFSWSSEDWELVDRNYKIANHYEYDDGVKVGDTYYIFEAGKVYTFSGPLEEASGKWKEAGTFPAKECDDMGVWHEDGKFHIFGEHGNFKHGPDGTSLAHFVSDTGLGDWKLVNAKAVDANPDGGDRFGVGDATIIKVEGMYYLFCDREEKGVPYRVTAWQSSDINEPFKYLGVAMAPRSDETDDWDNHRIQDADIVYVPELKRFVMTCNMMDTDGNPGGNFPTLKKNQSRVIGTFYADWEWQPKD